MSLHANQLITLIDDNCNTTSSSYPTAKKVVDINLALDRILALIFQADGRWKFDDSNHTDYPIITTDLVSGQRDYSFTSDDTGNLILEVYRVMVANEDGRFYDLTLEDQLIRGRAMGMVSGQNLTGKPSKYNKLANGIFLDSIPNYNYTDGLKIFINREASYFTALDTFYTTKKPGFAGLFHEYLALRPSYQYAYRKGLKNASILKVEMKEMEDKVEEFYSKRSKDEPTRIITKHRSSR